MAESTRILNTSYKIQHAKEEKFLEACSETQVVLASGSDKDAQIWYFYASGDRYDIRSAAFYNTCLKPASVSERSNIIGSKESDGWAISQTEGADTFQLTTCADMTLAMTPNKLKTGSILSKLPVSTRSSGNEAFQWNIINYTGCDQGSPDMTTGYYRIRNFNATLCLTIGTDANEKSIVVAKQQDADDRQKWKLQEREQNLYVLQNAMSGSFIGYAHFNIAEYALVTAQAEETKWRLKNMFGSAYTIGTAEETDQFAIGFSDYLPVVGDKAVLINNVAAQSQIWFFEPWDTFHPDKPITITDITVPEWGYRIRNVGTKRYISFMGIGGVDIQTVELGDIGTHFRAKNSGANLTSFHWMWGTDRVYYLYLDKDGLRTGSVASPFKLGAAQGRGEGYYITVPDTNPLQVIVDDPDSTGGKVKAVDLNASDPQGYQRWEFVPVSER